MLWFEKFSTSIVLFFKNLNKTKHIIKEIITQHTISDFINKVYIYLEIKYIFCLRLFCKNELIVSITYFLTFYYYVK